ncbi:type II toxin-antitoxin system prevent-host-death family antitoxin [Streptomyces scabiei]
MRVQSSTVRNDFTDMLNRAKAGEVIEIQKYGETVAVMISKDQYDRLTRDLFKNQ